MMTGNFLVDTIFQLKNVKENKVGCYREKKGVK